MKLILKIIFPIIVISLFVSCKPNLISKVNVDKYDYIVATADQDYVLNMPQLYDALYNSKVLDNGGVLEVDLVREFLDSMIVDSLLSFESDIEILKKDFYKWRIYKSQYHKHLLKAFYKQAVQDKVEVDSMEVVEYYNNNPHKFTVKEQVLIYQIYVAKKDLLYGPDSLKYNSLEEEEFFKAGMDYIMTIRDMVDSKESFMETAKTFSKDILSASQGGYVGWTIKGTYFPPFDSIAFAMREGDISAPYQDRDGWHVLYCDGYLPNALPPLNTRFYSNAKETFIREKESIIGTALLDTIFNEMEIEFNDSLLSANIYQLKKNDWMAVVNGIDTVIVEDVKRFENDYRKKYRVENTSPELKKIMLTEPARRYCLIQAAHKNKIDTLPDIVKSSNEMLLKYARAIISDDRYDVYWSPDDSLIEAYYNEHHDMFLAEKPLTVQHIIVEDSTLGEFIRDQAMAGIDFMELALEYYPGEESIRSELANLGDISEKDVSPEFFKAAMMTQVGYVSYPVKTEYGYHVIKVIEKRENMALDHARVKIIPILKKQHREETFENYKNRVFDKYNVEINGKLYPIHLKPKKLRT
ncbi:peptidylprolyl isomerase [Candidatus Zixiibacteriota bacterium]